MHFDAIILGSGQAGNPLALKLAEKGWSVALIERDQFGGTCVNVGCTPTKTLVQRAQIAHYARQALRWGVHAENVSVDMPKVLSQKDKVVHEWRDGVRESLEKEAKIRVFKGNAKFVGPKQIEVDSELLEAPKIFINVGAEPAIPNILGLAGTPYLINESIIELSEVPESLIVIGGGYIGLEFGQMFSRFGSKVTLLQNGGQIVPHEDEDVATELQRSLEDEGVVFRLNSEIQSVAYQNGFQISLADGRLQSSHLLVAAGRKPRTKDLDLEVAGVETNSNGSIKVNGRLETNVQGIWALGDVNGGPAFTHISYNDYQIVAANVLENANRSTADRIVPYCVFTDPQLGGFGMTERQARQSGKNIKVGKIKMSEVARAVERDETNGLMKLIVDANTDQILGATVLGVEGGEIVQILCTVAFLDQPYTKLESAIWIHPTLAEGLFRLIGSVS
jgi:pyruvate/2-oxoglutarate dehydrogenase complex dihydrolipoamide dehydrogenase (E3) component